MILRRVIKHFRQQEWTAIFLDFLIVVVGVYSAVWVRGYQDRRAQEVRKKLIIEALITDFNDAFLVRERFVNEIETELANWQSAFEKGEFPPPFYFRTTVSSIGWRSKGHLCRTVCAPVFS
ncbi:MAG: hypothetical protein COA84_16120 [Robiginitomaculum sp.]|nr:MAG: hypothetical protein COA84_16120 [Robiginitomaculum sp.]